MELATTWENFAAEQVTSQAVVVAIHSAARARIVSPQQDGAGLGDQALPVARHGDPAATCVILHLESAFGWWRTGP